MIFRSFRWTPQRKEIVFILLIKTIVLMVLWVMFFRHDAPVDAQSVAQHMLSILPTSSQPS